VTAGPPAVTAEEPGEQAVARFAAADVKEFGEILTAVGESLVASAPPLHDPSGGRLAGLDQRVGQRLESRFFSRGTPSSRQITVTGNG
jgi:hypothetical protein